MKKCTICATDIDELLQGIEKVEFGGIEFAVEITRLNDTQVLLCSTCIRRVCLRAFKLKGGK